MITIPRRLIRSTSFSTTRVMTTSVPSTEASGEELRRLAEQIVLLDPVLGHLLARAGERARLGLSQS